MRVEIKDGDVMHTLSVNPGTWEVFVDDALVKLSFREHLLFTMLGSCAGTIVSKEFIARCIYKTRTRRALGCLKVLACRLRKKLSAASGGRNYVVDVRCAGYKLA
jgi:two-component system cell cycle response regulator CtrA